MSFNFKTTVGCSWPWFFSAEASRPPVLPPLPTTSAHLCVSGILGNMGAQEGLGQTWVPHQAPFPSVLARAPLPSLVDCSVHPILSGSSSRAVTPQPCSSSPDEQTSWKNMVSRLPPMPLCLAQEEGGQKGIHQMERVTLEMEPV